MDHKQKENGVFSTKKEGSDQESISNRNRQYFSSAWILLVFLSVTPAVLSRDSDTLNILTLDDIFNSSFHEKSYKADWTNDNKLVHVSSSEGVQLYSPADDTTTIIVSPEIMSQYNVSDAKLSSTGDYVLLISNVEQVFRHSYLADYYIHDIEEDNTWPIPLPKSDDNSDRIQYAVWSPVENKVAFVFGNNVYMYTVSTNTSEQYTDNGERNKIYNGIPDWVYEEEVFGTNYALWWSSEGGYIAYLTFNDTKVQPFQFPVYGSRANKYTEIESIAYPKTGTTNPTVQASVISLNDGYTQDLAPPFDNRYYIISVAWANETTPMVGWMNRTQNSMSYCLYNIPKNGGRCQKIYVQSSVAWIESMVLSPIFTENGNKMLLMDSVPVRDDSFLHIIEIDTSSLEVTALTSGPWEVTNILGSNSQSILYTSTETNPWQRHVYSVEGGKCLTCEWLGRSDYTQDSLPSDCQYWSGSCSDDLSYCLLYCSGPTIPFTLLVEYNDQEFNPITYLETNSELKEFISGYDLPTVEEITIPAAGDTPELYARVMFPPGASKSCFNSYPMLFYVYAGPYSQMIGQYSVTSRQFPVYISSNLDTIVISVDGRGTGFRGDDFKYAVYRRLGILETEDQISAAKYFQSLCYTDGENTAIYGSSYGGYMAGMVGASSNGVFSAAISQAPVTDWIYYDTIYTERYMGLPSPEDNEEGYEASSLLFKAGNLSSIDYLLIHGTGDDNVHFQHSAQLVDILAKKEIQFRLQFYTDQAHALKGTPKHLYKLISDFLEESFGIF